jgi:para-aminobenzoate synthetase component 1
VSANGSLHRACRVAEVHGAFSLVDVLELWSAAPYTALLESLGNPSRVSRYSILCGDPFLVFRAKGAACFAGPPGRLEKLPGAPLDELAALLGRYGAPLSEAPGDLPFLGGAVGYLGYELLHQLERVPENPRDDLGVPDAYLLFCDTALIADAVTGKRWLVANGFDPSPEGAERQAEARLAQAREGLEKTLRDRARLAGERAVLPERTGRLREEDLARDAIHSATGREPYLRAVAEVKEQLRDGAIYQACLTHRLEAEFQGPGLGLYRVLRRTNPSPFAACLRFPEVEVLSSSPERFLRLDRAGWAEMRPIKGTRPRGCHPAEDERLRHELAHSEKDRAENVMIVDLARNDLGRVSELGTVHVPDLQAIEPHPFTFQMVSTVRGRIRAGLGPIDVLRAAFPGGSMTGAPKIEAMKLLSRLEPVRRDIYSGSLGYFDFDGSFDLNIVIRTFVKRGSRLFFHVGGGIVADSTAEDEYQETLDKAHALVRALEAARAG